VGGSARAVVVCTASRAARLGAVVVIAGALAGCGGTTPAVTPAAHPANERAWLDNARRFVGTLDSDIALSVDGGANLATAKHALTDESDVYAMLVAYTFFGDCRPELTNVGTPGARERAVIRTLLAACGRLQRASTLFQEAMTRHSARALLAATRLTLGTAPSLARARDQLEALR
jgi:hypothetical protein